MKTRLIALAATVALTGGMLAVPAAADANVHKRVHVTAGSTGHIVAYDIYWHNWGWHSRHKTIWPGHSSPRSWSVDYVRAVGQRCPGVLWWTQPSPDKRLGSDTLVARAHTTFRVTEDC